MALGAKSEDIETSLRDDLAASLADIEARESAAAPADDEASAPDAETKVEPADAEAERSDGRDAHGRFTSKEKVEPEPGAELVADPEPEAQPEAQDNPLAKAPQSWRADEAQEWAALTETARKAILRREESVAKMVGTQDSERLFGREVAEVFRPHMPTFEAFGVSPQFAVKVLLDNDKTLRSGTPEEKYGLARRMLNDYGLNPALLAQPDPNMPSDPHAIALQQRIDQLEARLNTPTDQQQFAPLPASQNEITIAQTIEAFRSDPAHPHFEAVQPVMARLLETEAATDLTEAYHMAVASRPDLRSTVTAPAPDPQRIQQDKTLAARRASASVSGSLGSVGTPQSTSLRDELRENLRAQGYSV
jgi:hypothetical protein